MHRRAVKFIFPDATLTTDQKLKEMRTMGLQKQPEYNKGLFMYRVLNNKAPEYISNLYTHTLPHAISTVRTLSLVCLGIFKTGISFSGAFLWNNLDQILSVI